MEELPLIFITFKPIVNILIFHYFESKISANLNFLYTNSNFFESLSFSEHTIRRRKFINTVCKTRLKIEFFLKKNEVSRVENGGLSQLHIYTVQKVSIISLLRNIFCTGLGC